MNTPKSAAVAAVSALALGALAACGGAPASADQLRGTAVFEPVDPRDVPLGVINSVIGPSEELGVQLLAAAEEGENVVVSPASLTIALAMLAPGASGPGEEELTRLLGDISTQASAGLGALLTSLSEWEGDPSAFDPEEIPETPLLHVANRAVIDDDFTVNDAYLDALSRDFDAGITVADLADPGTKEILDVWVEHHTAGLIPESAIEPDADLVLVLQNAVLFAAQWQFPFPEYSTQAKPFTTSSGEVIETDMMQGMVTISYVEQDGWTAITLPYTEGFSAMFALPSEGTDPLAAGAEETAVVLHNLESALREATPVPVRVQIPILDTSTTTDVVPILRSLGISAIFDPSSGSFEGISDAEIAVAEIVQQAVLRVTEEGTVAAAVTEMGMAVTSAPVVETEFRADRPFIMTVFESEFGWDVFQTVIRDPRN